MPNHLELALLLADARDGSPVLSQSVTPKDARGMVNPKDEKTSHGMHDTAADPNDLTKQRYAVLAPEGPRGDRLLALVKPLLDARKADQGGVPIDERRLPEDVDIAKARSFRDRLVRENAPRYWLVLGDFNEISLEATLALASHAFVGRLGFSKDDDYESYVHKVLRWEETPYTSTLGQTILCSVRDGTPATALAHRALLRPLEEVCTLERAQDRFHTEKPRLQEISNLSQFNSIYQSDEPTVLFSSSHGAGPPIDGYASPEEQRRLSGAMVLGREHLLGEHVTSGKFLPGGIWFYQACYGAGTPAQSAFAPWLKHAMDRGAINRDAAARALQGLPMNGTAPFVAALPRAALANPDGPLAMVGHVDLAWSAAFTEPGGRKDRQAMRFFGAIRPLVEGRRVGIAHGELSRFLLDTALELSDMYDDEERGLAPRNDNDRELRKAFYWMRRHDLGHYILLGDPAVRLPLAGNRVNRVTPDKNANIETMEKAALAVLGRDEPIEIVAQRMNLDPRDILQWAQEYAAAGKERLGKLRKS